MSRRSGTSEEFCSLCGKKGRKLVRRRIRWIAQGDELPQRIIRLRQWHSRSLVDDGQHFAAAHPLDRQALTFHRHHPVFFFKEFLFPQLHTCGMQNPLPLIPPNYDFYWVLIPAGNPRCLQRRVNWARCTLTRTNRASLNFLPSAVSNFRLRRLQSELDEPGPHRRTAAAVSRSTNA